MEENRPDRVLYRLHGCPYCERIARRLEEYDLSYDSYYVPPPHSQRDVVKRLGGTRSVPLLIDEQAGVTMAESANIAEYLRATYGEGVDA